MPNVGDIVEYEITDSDFATNALLTVGDKVPLLVISVNPEDGTYSGKVFDLNGDFYVHVPPASETPDNPFPSDIDSASDSTLDSDISKLSDAEKARLRAALDASDAASATNTATNVTSLAGGPTSDDTSSDAVTPAPEANVNPATTSEVQ